MSSFIRRIQRQQHPSKVCHFKLDKNDKPTGEPWANPPREKFFKGRGSKLGVHNPKAKDLLARLAREAKRAAQKGAVPC